MMEVDLMYLLCVCVCVCLCMWMCMFAGTPKEHIVDAMYTKFRKHILTKHPEWRVYIYIYKIITLVTPHVSNESFMTDDDDISIYIIYILSTPGCTKGRYR